MGNETKAGGTETKRIPFLLRRVTVPSWAQVIFTATWLFCLVRMMIDNPLLFATAVVGIVLISVVQVSSSNQTSQESKAYEETSTQQEVDVILWNRLRTYRVWHLALICVLVVIFFLDLARVFA